MIKPKTEIDAVITWINGNDKNHRKKRAKHLIKEKKVKENSLPTGADNTRFIDNGELKFCITSIRKFAPWIRKIHVVTDNQTPDFLTPDVQKQLNVELVDHKEIFRKFEWALPTFNSRTIETALWRIPGIAPRFIYFNDDFILAKPVEPSDFFLEDNVVLRGNWNKMRNYGPVRIQLNNFFSFLTKKVFGITRSMNLLLQIRSAQLAGFSKKYHRVPHVPHPVKTKTLQKFFKKNPSIFEKNIRYRFRNLDQFNGIYLANHLEIKNEQAVLKGTDDILMINGEMDYSFQVNSKLKKIEQQDVRFICIQGFEKFRKDQREIIKSTLNNILLNN